MGWGVCCSFWSLGGKGGLGVLCGCVLLCSYIIGGKGVYMGKRVHRADFGIYSASGQVRDDGYGLGKGRMKR